MKTTAVFLKCPMSGLAIVPLLLTILLSGCGVKGKPLPPLEPAEIGRGAPTYKRAAEQAKPAAVPTATPDRRGP